VENFGVIFDSFNVDKSVSSSYKKKLHECCSSCRNSSSIAYAVFKHNSCKKHDIVTTGFKQVALEFSTVTDTDYFFVGLYMNFRYLNSH
jgi:hypothetical protein